MYEESKGISSHTFHFLLEVGSCSFKVRVNSFERWPEGFCEDYKHDSAVYEPMRTIIPSRIYLWATLMEQELCTIVADWETSAGRRFLREFPGLKGHFLVTFYQLSRRVEFFQFRKQISNYAEENSSSQLNVSYKSVILQNGISFSSGTR